MRILAVDDDPIILELLEQSLGVHDAYDLITCSSAEQAMIVLDNDPTPFDCFLLDVMLPGVDGIELCDAIRQTKNYVATPIIMITASREPDLMEQAFYAGATDFICKPLDGVELGARINSAGMLNDSLHREREVRHTLAELTAKLKLRFDEAVKLDTPGVTLPAAMENTLLRMPAGCYAMSPFALDILGLRGIHRAVSPQAFRAHLEQVAVAATEAVKNRSYMIAYGGGGRFLGTLMGRERFQPDALLTEMNKTLTANWDADVCGTPMPPALRLTRLSDQRLWSGLSVSDLFHKHQHNGDLLSGVDSNQEDTLFDRLGNMGK